MTYDRLAKLKQQIINIVQDCNKTELNLLMKFIDCDFGRVVWMREDDKKVNTVI